MLGILNYLLIAVGINMVMFIPGFLLKTDKLTDLSYSLSFIILIIVSVIFSDISPAKIVLSSMIIIWGLRLGIFLFIRIHKIRYDRRFDGIRESFLRFLRFWVLQGLAVWVILLPALLFISGETGRVSWVGIAVWALGLLTESFADFQKYRFNQKNRGKGKFINTGLWKYSRHPNYFGEILCWVGVYTFTFGSLSPTQKVIGLTSPLFIMVLLLFVTGIPLLEKQADIRGGSQKSYMDYKKKTSILIPWIPKR